MSDTNGKIATNNYRSGQFSSAEAGRLAWDILETYGLEDDRDLHVFLTAQLRELPSSGGTAQDIWAELSEPLALQIMFADQEDRAVQQSTATLLFIIAFSKRGPDEADDLASFDFEASPWWRKLTNGLREFSDTWAEEEKQYSEENPAPPAVGRSSTDN